MLYYFKTKSLTGWALYEKQFHIIRKNFELGKPWFICSPMFAISREGIAEVVNAKTSELVKV